MAQRPLCEKLLQYLAIIPPSSNTLNVSVITICSSDSNHFGVTYRIHQACDCKVLCSSTITIMKLYCGINIFAFLCLLIRLVFSSTFISQKLRPVVQQQSALSHVLVSELHVLDTCSTEMFRYCRNLYHVFETEQTEGCQTEIWILALLLRHS